MIENHESSGENVRPQTERSLCETVEGRSKAPQKEIRDPGELRQPPSRDMLNGGADFVEGLVDVEIL